MILCTFAANFPNNNSSPTRNDESRDRKKKNICDYLAP